jgi:hypothetical protein
MIFVNFLFCNFRTKQNWNNQKHIEQINYKFVNIKTLNFFEELDRSFIKNSKKITHNVSELFLL